MKKFEKVYIRSGLAQNWSHSIVEFWVFLLRLLWASFRCGYSFFMELIVLRNTWSPFAWLRFAPVLCSLLPAQFLSKKNFLHLSNPMMNVSMNVSRTFCSKNRFGQFTSHKKNLKKTVFEFRFGKSKNQRNFWRNTKICWKMEWNCHVCHEICGWSVRCNSKSYHQLVRVFHHWCGQWCFRFANPNVVSFLFVFYYFPRILAKPKIIRLKLLWSLNYS